MSCAVDANGLLFRYPNGVMGLDGIDLHVTHGERVAVLGPNGAGKTTLMLHLNGLLTGEGEPEVAGIRVGEGDVRELRAAVGLVFQDPDDQLFMPTVFDDVAFGPLNLGLPAAEVAARVEAALARVEALHLQERPPYKLSTGEKRAVAIASVLSMRPDILIMDEPSAGLDPRTRRRLIELLASFHHTKIVATHDLDLVLDLCARTIVIHQGMVMADGPTLEIFNNAELMAASHLEKPLRLQGCPVCGTGEPKPAPLFPADAGLRRPHPGEHEHQHD